MRNTKNILQHELIGLECEIIKSRNKYHVGLKGKVIDETMKTLVLKNREKKQIQKNGTTFRLKFNGEVVDIDGNFIVSRPEDRIKKRIKKW